ncbi:bifunctional oligoribonuclease/PAP phosphatase NrnA [Patescibacteria group bacterium]|nr:bifunctional oligoribonuclease/PAP phosphatase NrnA [Patescibacteria group bacterium]
MMEFYPLFQKIKEEIEKAQKVVVIAHQNPDGDTLGALLGIAHYLKLNNTDHKLFCTTSVPDYLRFLPNVDAVHSHESILLDNEFDVIIILDSGDLAYAGVDIHFRKLKGLPIVINIDHHGTNTNYGHINLVHPQASSTSEIIYHFLDYFRTPIDKEVATSLLTGILTDTGGFSNMGTTPSSMEVSSKLLALGARAREIVSNTLQNKSLAQLQLWGRALSRLKQDKKTGIVSTILTQKDFQELKIEESSEGIANFLNNVEQAKAILVMYEKGDGTIKGSLRTTRNDVDVSKIAKYFGGGGHAKAAGFSIKGTFVETKTGWQVIESPKQDNFIDKLSKAIRM